MIGRMLNTLRRPSAERIGPTRPNELSRDVARTERLRREALRDGGAADRPRPAAEEQRPARPPRSVEVAPGAERRSGHPALVAALRSRAGFRQALLMAEILGPPRSLRPADSQRFEP